MRRYRAVLTAEFTVEAENVAQARYALRRVKAIGEHYGWRGEQHGRGTRHRVERVSERVDVESVGGDAGGGER